MGRKAGSLRSPATRRAGLFHASMQADGPVSAQTGRTNGAPRTTGAPVRVAECGWSAAPVRYRYQYTRALPYSTLIGLRICIHLFYLWQEHFATRALQKVDSRPAGRISGMKARYPGTSAIDEMEGRSDTPEGVQRPRNQSGSNRRPSSTMPLDDGDTHRLRDTTVMYGRCAAR